MSVEIESVVSGSPCAAAGVRGGDFLLSADGRPVNDVLDYGFYTSGRRVRLCLSRGEGKYSVTIFKEEGQDAGLVFKTFLGSRHKSCRNHCIFCFIDQLPRGLRRPLYFKDDDERLSYLLGNYISLTNLSDEEAERVCRMKLSPMNISVHTMNPELRCKMLGNPSAGSSLRYLGEFDRAGIEMNFQIVLCPGINDGEELVSTLKRLSEYRHTASVAAVPVGLTGYREGLYSLRGYDREGAREVIRIVDSFAAGAEGVFTAADEFYILAGLPVPSADYYGEYCQLENGVGMLRLLTDEFGERMRLSGGVRPACGPRLIVTGEAAFGTIEALVKSFNARFSTEHRVTAAKNRLFGGLVTVTGLLGGRDVASAAAAYPDMGEVLICDCMLKRGEGLFLDGLTVPDVEKLCGKRIITAENSGGALFEALAGEEPPSERHGEEGTSQWQ